MSWLEQLTLESPARKGKLKGGANERIEFKVNPVDYQRALYILQHANDPELRTLSDIGRDAWAIWLEINEAYLSPHDRELLHAEQARERLEIIKRRRLEKKSFLDELENEIKEASDDEYAQLELRDTIISVAKTHIEDIVFINKLRRIYPELDSTGVFDQ